MLEPFPHTMGDYVTRAYGLGNLTPLLGMGSTLAGYMGHTNLAKMLGTANGLLGKLPSAFPGISGSPASSGGFGGFGGGLFGAPYYPGLPQGFGSPGWPYHGMSGYGMPHFPQGSVFTGAGSPYSGPQSYGLGGFMPSLFGSQGGFPGGAGSMPGFFY